MRVIYTSEGVMKMLGCALYISCTLSIEEYYYLEHDVPVLANMLAITNLHKKMHKIVLL
jgi:hypothetical protein